MKFLRFLLPVISCYATDAVAFDGQYFGHFLKEIQVHGTAGGAANVLDVFAGSLSPTTSLARVDMDVICRLYAACP